MTFRSIILNNKHTFIILDTPSSVLYMYAPYPVIPIVEACITFDADFDAIRSI